MDVYINGGKRRTLEPGSSFGDFALLYNSKRTASVKSTGECELYGINRD